VAKLNSKLRFVFYCVVAGTPIRTKGDVLPSLLFININKVPMHMRF
jgi:hypothetical protein